MVDSPTLLAYEQTAAHYDEFTAHHDYELWLGNLLPALRDLGLRGNRLLDIACGTGKSFLAMLEQGWHVVAIDLSPSMLARARAKAAGRARVELADMRRLPHLGEFDLIWCLDDAVNYLLSTHELELFFRSLRRNMRGHTLGLFDVSTLVTYRTFFAQTQAVETPRGSLIWTGQTSPRMEPGSEAEAWLEVQPGPGRARIRAVHRQRHFRPAEIQDALTRAGLVSVAVFGHGHDAVLRQPLDESEHTKAIFIVRRGEGR